MTADQLTQLLARFPKDQRKAVGERIHKFIGRFWQDIRIYDRFPVADPTIDDLIGTDPTTGDTEFLKDHVTPRA